MKTITLYHYTRKKNNSQILKTGIKSKFCENNSIFTLENINPTEWTNNQYFPNIWEEFLKSKNGHIFKINVEPNNKILVKDYAHLVNFNPKLKKSIKELPDNYKHQTEKEAIDAYNKNFYPYLEYISKKEQLKLILPEIIIKDSNIEIEKLEQIK